MADFPIDEKKADKMTIAEFNIYNYMKIDLGNGKNGIVVYSYTKREDITNFLKNLEEDRTSYLKQIISTEIPAVKF